MLSKSKVARHHHVGAPHLLHSLLEPRAFFEAAMLPMSLPLLMQAPQGDGHPVLLLPGFMADEKSLFVLKAFLERKGYNVQTWGLGCTWTFPASTPVPCHKRYATCIT